VAGRRLSARRWLISVLRSARKQVAELVLAAQQMRSGEHARVRLLNEVFGFLPLAKGANVRLTLRE
jgi:hypothetical protein